MIKAREITQNTVIGLSVGTIAAIVVGGWTMLGIGRPLFASDLEQIRQQLATYQTTTAIEILINRKASLKSELRQASRDLRNDPNDRIAQEDIEEIRNAIEEIDQKIRCHRTTGCRVERIL